MPNSPLPVSPCMLPISIPTRTAIKISTSGPRNSRREGWRLSKGMLAQPNRPSTLNKQGIVKARRKAGRSHRRR
jgi:hypothetical protein